MILQGSAPGGAKSRRVWRRTEDAAKAGESWRRGFESADSKGCHLWRTGLGRREAQCLSSLGGFLSRECNGAFGVAAREGERAADQRATRLAQWNVGEEKFQGSVFGGAGVRRISRRSLQGELKCASLAPRGAMVIRGKFFLLIPVA